MKNEFHFWYTATFHKQVHNMHAVHIPWALRLLSTFPLTGWSPPLMKREERDFPLVTNNPLSWACWKLSRKRSSTSEAANREDIKNNAAAYDPRRRRDPMSPWQDNHAREIGGSSAPDHELPPRSPCTLGCPSPFVHQKMAVSYTTPESNAHIYLPLSLTCTHFFPPISLLLKWIGSHKLATVSTTLAVSGNK